MARLMKITIGVCLILAITYIVVLPAFNISPTALRAARNADLLFISIAAAAYLLIALRRQPGRDLLVPAVFYSPSSDLIDLTCTRLC